MSVRRLLFWFVGLIVVLAASGLVVGCSLSAPKYRGPASAHFNGEEFFTPGATGEQHGFGSVLKWYLNRDKGPWPPQPNAPQGPSPPAQVPAGEIRLTFVNHSTFLLQTAGLNILTDPIWSERCSPVSWAGPKRQRPPGLRFEDLPHIDAVIISHNHYDHLDLETLRRLAARDQPRIIVPLGVKALLDEERIPNTLELDWWQTQELMPQVEVNCVPCQHFSGRGLTDRNATLWASYVLRTPAGYVYFGGDTGYGPHFKAIAERFPNMDVAILPIGAYRPRWFMQPIHMSPAEAVQAHRDLGARRSVATHFGTFQMADDGLTEPVTDLRAAQREQQVPDSAFLVLPEGFGRVFRR